MTMTIHHWLYMLIWWEHEWTWWSTIGWNEWPMSFKPTRLSSHVYVDFFIWVNHETSSSAWICLAFLGDPPLFPLTASSWFPPLFTYQPTCGFRRINSNTWKKMRLWEQQQWTNDSHDIYGQWSDIWARMWYLGWCKPVSRGVRVWMSKKSGVNLAIYGDLTIKRRNLTNIRKDACPKIWHRHWLHCLVVPAVAIWHTGRKILENHHCQCLQDAMSAC
jgi:hypothetical protein